MGQSETEGEEVDCAAPSLPSPEIRLSRTAQSAALSALDPFLNLFLGLSAQAVVSLRLRRSHGPKTSLSSCHSGQLPNYGSDAPSPWATHAANLPMAGTRSRAIRCHRSNEGGKGPPVPAFALPAGFLLIRTRSKLRLEYWLGALPIPAISVLLRC